MLGDDYIQQLQVRGLADRHVMRFGDEGQKQSFMKHSNSVHTCQKRMITFRRLGAMQRF